MGAHKDIKTLAQAEVMPLNTYIYLGTSTRESRRRLLNIGCAMGAQHIRKMTMGEHIAALANRGDARAIQYCEANPDIWQRVK